MCILSLITSGLALGQIFSYLVAGERIFVLCTFENACLRLCFTAIIILIGMRDIAQIQINLFVRTSGAMMGADGSRFVMVEFLVRTCISLLAMMTILIVIFTTPKDAYESVIDQTMNFTALVILLEVDNILAALFQKKIDSYNIDFGYNKDTIEEDFNKTADFMTKRQSLYPIQRFFEKTILGLLTAGMYCVFVVIPVGMILLYIIIPPKEVIRV